MFVVTFAAEQGLRSLQRPRRGNRRPPVLRLPAEIGVGLTGLGFLFFVLGVLFFFDRGLLAMGNVRC